GYMLGS
nr:Chain A, Major prion protein [synthetic construct]3MD4_B Chain B, Major prion protein [synthetic construct]3NHC_A Chain A, Major prion protein [Homo sapiens]3NHC_B Chain B, Major prion protein [Homo sapiens]4WBU_A Chain A, PrP peptide [synthetic construct]4WBU_B Chain B, PrP peptide [synthetic construct]